MTDTVVLRRKIEERGLKLTFVAQRCGITYQGFLNKLQGKTTFTVSEIKILRQLLNLSNKEVLYIFLGIK